MPEEPEARLAASDLTEYVGASSSDADYVEQVWNEASALVDNLIGTRTVPAAVVDRCYLEAGSELFHRRQAPNGIAQFATADGANPVRVARDPLIGVYPILTPYLGGGFA